MLRSETDSWTERVEKPTKYCVNLENRDYIRKIVELEFSNGKHLPKADEIMKEIENFSSDLYTTNVDIKGDRLENLVYNLETKRSHRKFDDYF